MEYGDMSLQQLRREYYVLMVLWTYSNTLPGPERESIALKMQQIRDVCDPKGWRLAA